MEPYRAPSLFPDLQKLGWRTPRQLSQDPSLLSFHQNSIRHVGQCSSRPSTLSDRHRTYTATTSSTPRQAPPNPPQVELHYLTQSVKLFLRRSFAEELSPPHFVHRLAGMLQNVKLVVDDPALRHPLFQALPVR